MRTCLLAIPMLFGLLLLTLGLAWAFATLNVFYRDIEHLLTVLFLPWFFLTPVFYSLESIPAAADNESVVTSSATRTRSRPTSRASAACSGTASSSARPS